jgi:hypothetical protein
MFDNDKAVEELQKTIDSIDFAGGPEPSPTPAAEPKEPAATPTPTPEPEAKPEPKPQDAAPAPDEPKEPAGKEEPATPESGEPRPADEPKAIPDSHYRAALHMGWKPEDIGELYDKSPEVALKTLAKCYEQVNATSKQLGELGQRARQMREQPAAPAAPQPSRKEAVMKKLKEEYEDNPIIDLLGELIPDQAQPTPRQAPESPAPQAPTVDQEIAIRQQINTFFTADEMDVFQDFYGATSQAGDWSLLTPGQRANRIEVCNRAQNILDGATMAGMQVSTAEAMERAHLEVTAPIAEQFVRERIVKSAQKRAAGVTLKPSGSKTPAPAAGQYNKEEAVKEMGAELKKVLG